MAAALSGSDCTLRHSAACEVESSDMLLQAPQPRLFVLLVLTAAAAPLSCLKACFPTSQRAQTWWCSPTTRCSPSSGSR